MWTPSCRMVDIDLLRSVWFTTDHALCNTAQIYFPGDEFVNMMLLFEKNPEFGVFRLDNGKPLTFKTNKGGYSQIKGHLEVDQQISIEYLFNILDKKQNKQSNKYSHQILYLIACNPYPLTIGYRTTKKIAKEYQFINKIRKKIQNNGKTRFKPCLTMKKKFVGSKRPYESPPSGNNNSLLTSDQLYYFTKSMPNNNKLGFSKSVKKRIKKHEKILKTKTSR